MKDLPAAENGQLEGVRWWRAVVETLGRVSNAGVCRLEDASGWFDRALKLVKAKAERPGQW